MTATNTNPATSTILAFLFTDLEGSTRLWQAFPEAMKTALARHDELLHAAVEGANGQVVKTTGDGIHAVFGSADGAVDACIAAQRCLLQENWGEPGPLRVRMGLHIGEAQQRGGDYYGTTLNRAARLMAAAHGGQVLLSAAVAALVGGRLPGGASLRDLGEHRLKDLQRPEHVYQLVHPALPHDFPPIASLNRLANNLPTQPTVFVGRQEELNEVKELIVEESVRLVTLIGPGGTGKTRLALQTGAEVVDRFVDGAYFVDLAPIRDPASVLPTISRTLGLSETSDRPIVEDLKSQLQQKGMLLLLDNFEQVTAAAVDVAELIQYCPRLKLLATSREALRVRGEHLYPVPPLGLPQVNGRRPPLAELAQYESVQLFVERAQAVRPGFELTEENARAVAELCLRLDGLPLAIELAAARIRLFSPQQLQQRLSSRLQLLRGGARDLPERQQTLRDTIDWSYELLEPDEKMLFAVVSVFSGCTFEALEAVARDIRRLDGDVDVVDGIVSLADKSLLRVSDPVLDGATLEPRLRMLETIREYAADRLSTEPALSAATCLAHASYYADFASRQWRRMAGSERDMALKEMAVDVENLKIAWRYWTQRGALAQLHKMVDGMWLLYDARGWYLAAAELTADLLNVLASTPSSPEHAQQEITLQTSLARALLAIKGYTPEVEEAYQRALALTEGLGEVPQLFPVLRGLASYYLYRGQFEKARQFGERILALAESKDDDQLRLHGYLVLGANTGFTQGFRAGLQLLDKGIELFERTSQSFQPYQVGNYPGIPCYTTSAFFLWWLGYPDRARERMQRAFEMASALNHPFTLAYALYHTGAFHLLRGELDLAAGRAQALSTVAEEYGFQIWETLSEILGGAVQAAQRDAQEGLARIEQGFVDYRGLKSPPVFYPQLVIIRAMATMQAGRAGDALRLVDDFLLSVPETYVMRDAPQLSLLKAQLLAAMSPADATAVAGAAASLQRTVDEALAMENRTVALQAATALCRLPMQQGDARETRRQLAEIYATFSEGFDTADLQAARAVLDELEG